MEGGVTFDLTNCVGEKCLRLLHDTIFKSRLYQLMRFAHLFVCNNTAINCMIDLSISWNSSHTSYE